jgi:selenocysteine lyase/cysteine desulfurase
VLPNQGHFFNAGSLYKRFTPAGPDHAQIAASAGMADYVDDVYTHHLTGDAPPLDRAAAVHDLMRAREIELLQPLLDFLSEKNSVRLLGPKKAELRAPTVTLVLGEPGEAVAAKLAPHGIMCGGGDFYGVRCLKAQGVDPGHGAVRVSFVHYTAKEEVTKLMKALDDLV